MGIDPSYGLFRLGVEQGGNLRLWRMAVDLQAERIREAIALDRERHDDGRWRVDADAHFLLVAVRNGLRFAERLQGMAPESRLAAALADFTRRFRSRATCGTS